MSPSASWWLRLLLVLALPFAIVIATYQMAMQFPGAVRLASWEWFASVVFLVALMPVFLVLRQPIQFRSGRIAGGVFVTLLFVYSALIMHVHATCKYISPFIGGLPQPELQAHGVQSAGAATSSKEGAVNAAPSNPALNLAPFGRWTLRDKVAQRRLAPR